jgi:hypothetical protein
MSYENNPSHVAMNAKDYDRFVNGYEKEEPAQEYDPPEYNQTKYLKKKVNAKPIKAVRVNNARNNIKQIQRW